jgi:hypothetical protein
MLDETQQLLSDRHTLDTIARAVVTGERGLGGSFDRMADDIASLMINRLAALKALGFGRVAHLTWDDPIRWQETANHYSERTIRTILVRVEKHLTTHGWEAFDGRAQSG